MKEILRFEQVTKRFPGVLALDHVSFKLHEGEILGLCGENGAGKSTLLKILAGVYNDYEGQIFIGEEEVKFQMPKDAMGAGISVIYQELNFLNDLSVAENIFLGKWPQKHGVVDFQLMNQTAKETLKSLNVTNLEPSKPMRELTVAQKQIVEIAKAITNDCRILVMDEPTSALSDLEIDSLLTVVKRLRDQRNLSIIYVSHKLNEIFSICDRVQVIRDGKTISNYPIGEVTREILIRDMVGREMQDIFPQIKTEIGQTALETVGLTGKYVTNINLNVHEGEIVGVYGLMGSGTVELADTLFGVNRVYSGDIYIRGKRVAIKHPQDSVRNGIAYLTSDRKGTGLILGQSICQNISTASLKKTANRFGVLSRSKEETNAEKWREKLRIKTPSVEQLVQNLSGGNQQKVVIGKWLNTDCKILIFCDPTRGIDVNAKYEIYKILKELCQEGFSILLVSHEIPEVMGITDRLYVIKDGMFTAELRPEEYEQNRILEYAIGKD